jgi:hypothetical protein
VAIDGALCVQDVVERREPLGGCRGCW